MTLPVALEATTHPQPPDTGEHNDVNCLVMTTEALQKTAVYHAMYPATVLLPGGIQHTRTKVFATPDGLAIYWAVPADCVTPDWFAPIDYQLTGRPRAGYAAKVGWDVFTTKGLVTVTAEGGCGCGWPLKRWSPAFARRRLRWPATA